MKNDVFKNIAAKYKQNSLSLKLTNMKKTVSFPENKRSEDSD